MEATDKGKVAVISMARNDHFFISKWIDYYGHMFGLQNLFLILDGYDQPLPDQHKSMNIIRIQHTPMPRLKGDRFRARLVSEKAKTLFQQGYQRVIAHDIDEFLVLDPKTNQSLQQYLLKPAKTSSRSALGLDVGQHLKEEEAINPSIPFLQQRKYAHVSARYTKAIVAHRPVVWGSGYHRVKGCNFHIDPNLYLFHFGMVDYAQCKNKIESKELLKEGWRGHFDRRFQLFQLIRNKKEILDGDGFFPKARRRQSMCRSLFAWNKPGMLREKPVVKIPERFRDIV